MRVAISLIFFVFASAPFVHAQSPSATAEIPIRIQLPNSDLTTVLQFYEQISKRKVWVELGLAAKVSIFTHHDISRTEALSLIRGTLLQEGIEVREVGDAQAFVTRTLNPQTKVLLPSPSSSVARPSFSVSLSPTPTPHVRGLPTPPPSS